MDRNDTENSPTREDEPGREARAEWNFRRFLPQILACTANNFILFDNSLALSLPTILIVALTNNDGDLSLTADEASWFASMFLIFQPIGSVFYGMVMEPLGRKRSLLLLNIPFFTAWTMIFYAESHSTLYAASAIMGFGVGCTEAPLLTYIGEITEPLYRGTLTSYVQFCGFAAYAVVYSVGPVTTWRYTAAICATVPILTVVAVSQLPETPHWLVSRGKVERTEESLRWLRGWVRPEDVREELDRIVNYDADEKTVKTLIAESHGALTSRHVGIKQRIVFFLRPEIRRPLILTVSLFFFYYASGMATFRPYLVPVMKELEVTMNIDKATVTVAILGLIGYAACMFSVSQVGKRALSLFSLLGSSLCSFLLASVASGSLDRSWSLPVLLAMSFLSCVGLAPIPWMLQSEIYPFHGKCMASGIAAAASYIIGFFATNIFLGMEDILGLSGVFILFGTFGLLGAVYTYMRLPETEGRTFQQIQSHFVDP